MTKTNEPSCPIKEDWIESLPNAKGNAIQALDDLVYCYNLAVEIQTYIHDLWPDLINRAKEYQGELVLKPAEAGYEHCLKLNEQIFDKTHALKAMMDDMDYIDTLLFYNALNARSAKSMLEPLAKGKNKKVIEAVIEKLKQIYENGRITRLWNYFEELVNENIE